MAFLTRDEILAKRGQRNYEIVAVPEWGGEVKVQSLLGSERDAFEASVMTQRGNSRELNLRNARAKLVALCVADEAGRPLFTLADVQELGELSAAALDRVFAVAQKLNGLAPADVEELAGN